MKRQVWKTLQNRAGFTLVELIVVIAILGILAGVGTVTYSGYIKKANQAKDIQLAGDVKYALTLAGWSKALPEGGGTVVLSTDAAPVCKDAEGNSSTEIEAALQAAFGGGYQDLLRLAYDGWDSSAAADVVAEYAGSSFEGNEKDLLSDIQTLTNAVKNMMTADGIDASVITELMAGSLGNYLKDNGLANEDGTIVEGKEQEVANTVTLFVAKQVSDLKNESYEDGTTDQDKVVNKWKENNFATMLSSMPEADRTNPGAIAMKMLNQYNGTGLSTVGMMATYYANVEAMVQYVNSPSIKATIDPDALQTFNTAFGNVKFENVANRINERDESETAVNAATNAVFEEMATAYLNMFAAASSDGSGTLAAAISSYNSSPQAEKDAKAYMSTLGAVNESADVIGGDLTKTNLYGDGTVLNLLTGYISLGDAMKDVNNGIGIVVTKQEDGSYQALAYPIDYVK